MMRHSADDEQQARALLDTIETRVLDTISSVLVTDLAMDSIRASHYIMANALIELTGRVMGELIREAPEMRPRCVQLIDHLSLYLAPMPGRPQ